MKNTSKVTHISAYLLSTVLMLSACGGGSSGASSEAGASSPAPVSASAEPVFFDADQEGHMLADLESEIAAELSKARRRRYVRVNFGALKRLAESAPLGQSVDVSGTVSINVFADESLDIALENIEKVSDDNIIFSGRIVDDENSAATLVMNEQILVANIRKGESEESYEVRHARGELHTVSIRPDEADEEGPCPALPAPMESPQEQARQDAALGEVDGVLASPEIDVLAAYTPYARSYAGSESAIRALIQMGVADTNAALRDSGSVLRVRLVGIQAVKKNETGNWSKDLASLRGKSDGRWDEVHAERARLGADQVTLVGRYSSGGGTAGIGYVKAGASSAFAIVKASAFRMYTFSHELGHNLGLNHSDGYVNSAGRFRTIIAYGSYPRIRRYSNPAKSYNGYKTGTNAKDEVSIINTNSLRAANLVPKRI